MRIFATLLPILSISLVSASAGPGSTAARSARGGVESALQSGPNDPLAREIKDGYFYGRGTSDDKGMAAQFVANLIRLKREGVTPERDVILALTADEEGGTFNGVEWLLKNLSQEASRAGTPR